MQGSASHDAPHITKLKKEINAVSGAKKRGQKVRWHRMLSGAMLGEMVAMD